MPIPLRSRICFTLRDQRCELRVTEARFADLGSPLLLVDVRDELRIGVTLVQLPEILLEFRCGHRAKPSLRGGA